MCFVNFSKYRETMARVMTVGDRVHVRVEATSETPEEVDSAAILAPPHRSDNQAWPQRNASCLTSTEGSGSIANRLRGRRLVCGKDQVHPIVSVVPQPSFACESRRQA